jgi:hypothetical protein
MFDIGLLDHVIISQHGYYSMQNHEDIQTTSIRFACVAAGSPE